MVKFKLNKLIFFVFVLVYSNANSQVYYFDIKFKNKSNSNFDTLNPHLFLSEKAIQRRLKNNILVTQEDLPVNQNYLDSVKIWAKINAVSKWFNLCAVSLNDSAKIDSLKKYEFISEIKYIGKNNSSFSRDSRRQKWLSESQGTTIDYGNSNYGIKQLNGDYLHEKNFLAQGVNIAVFDGGFLNVDNMSAFSHLFTENKIVYTKNLVKPSISVYSATDHGTMVLSILASKKESEIFGSAPMANYLLFLTEDVYQENLIEEYFWLNAAELADSAGADVINSSLGYYDFDTPAFNHSYADYGNTTLITKAANKAFDKGILIFNSAGNEGNSPWKHIVFPADGKNVIAVGGVTQNGDRSGFSSIGYDINNLIKPNVVGLASSTYVLIDENIGQFSNGTSFSSPLICGLGSCLWQAFPEKSNLEIKSMIEESSHLYNSPNENLGYGIPNFKMTYLNELEKSNFYHPELKLFPNPIIENKFTISFSENNPIIKEIQIIDVNGKNFSGFKHQKISDISYLIHTSNLNSGTYFLKLITQTNTYVKTIQIK